MVILSRPIVSDQIKINTLSFILVLTLQDNGLVFVDFNGVFETWRLKKVGVNL